MRLSVFVELLISEIKKGCAEAGCKPPESVSLEVNVYEDGAMGGNEKVSFLVSLANDERMHHYQRGRASITGWC
jgi:hypothetical protein